MMNAFCGGSGCSMSHFKVTGVVCDRRTARSASLRSHLYRHPALPVPPPFSWASATLRKIDSSGRRRVDGLAR